MSKLKNQNPRSIQKKGFFFIVFFLIATTICYLNLAYARVYSLFYKTTNPNMALNYMVGNPRAVKTIRYAALGDSLTAGVGAEKIEKSFPYLLSEKIIDKKTKIKLFNLGQPGAKSMDVINQQLVPLASFQPDLVTLFIGTNDMHNKISVENFKENYTKILDELSKYKKAKIILINLPYLGADHLILPPYRSYFDKKIQKYNAAIAEIARERQLTLVDLYDETQAPFANNQDKMYSVDKYHPSADGYALWADLIYVSYR